MKRILLSLLTVAAVSAIGITATRAFFSDVETSEDNVFTAGAIDLKIDNTSYALDHNIPGFTDPQGVLVSSTNTSWQLYDLTIQKFFNFEDLKPGDYGEDTISIHVNNNDAWLCAAARVTDNSDQDCTESELDDDSTCVTETSGTNGDLAQQVNFAFWKDDGDNVFESDESTFLNGPISGLGTAGQIKLSDSTGGPLGPGAVVGDTDVFIGKAWCFGTLTEASVTPGGYPQGPLTTVDSTTIGTGFTCDGSGVDNAAQTDQVVGDMQFYAEQSRNNGTFTCADDYIPTWPTPTPTLTP